MNKRQLIMRRFIFFTGFMFSFLLNDAQNSPGVLDGVFIRENNFGRKPINYNHEGEINMMWTKRVWRVIDLREKINHPFYYPLEPSNSLKNLITVLRDGMCAGELSAYEATSDEFLYRLAAGEGCKMGERVDTLWIENELGELVPTPINEPFPTENIRRFRIKEDWYFDKIRSVMEVRIIGICPVEEVFDSNGDYKGERPLYWFYMPELRYTISNAPAPNPYSDVERRTYDDLFNKRKFSSYVMKESNVYDRNISTYKNGLDALLEGKRIEEEIFTYEQDLWEY